MKARYKRSPDRRRLPQFTLPIAPDVRLVSVDTARAVCGATAEEIFARIEDPKSAAYLPAFDLHTARASRRSPRREIRIWVGALLPPQPAGRRRRSAANRQLEIIADCLFTNVADLTNRQFLLTTPLLERAWCVSNESLLRLIVGKFIAGVRFGHKWRINRASAAAFLKRRAL